MEPTPETQRWARWGVALAAFVVTISGGVAWAGGETRPAVPDSTEARLRTVELRVDTLSARMDRRDGVQFCRWRAQDSGIDPRLCWDLLPNAAEFDPPGRR